MTDLDSCQSAYLIGVRDGMKAAIAVVQGIRNITDIVGGDFTPLVDSTCMSVLDVAELIGKEAIS